MLYFKGHSLSAGRNWKGGMLLYVFTAEKPAGRLLPAAPDCTKIPNVGIVFPPL